MSSIKTNLNHSSFNAIVEDYLKMVSTIDGILDQAAFNWRCYCFKHGRGLVKQLEEYGHSLEGKNVLDIGCGWGGHAFAFIEAGAIVTAVDINDHKFSKLKQFASDNQLPLKTEIGDCQNLQFPDKSFDYILGLELIEHIENVSMFADGVRRLLRPNGVAIISTPPRLKSVVMGEPHYGLKYLALLPFKLQGLVARNLFNKEYPFPITKQYSLSSSVVRPFREQGLKVEVIISRGIQKKIPKFLHPLFRMCFWSLFYIKK